MTLYTPEPQTPIITVWDHLRLREFVIYGTEYDLCEQLSHNRGCTTKDASFYNNGFNNDETDPAKVTRHGLVGEFGYGKDQELPVDLARKRADHYDFLRDWDRIDVKTASNLSRNGNWFITAKNDKEQWVPLKCHLYVFAMIIEEHRLDRWAKVALVGQMTAREVRKLQPVKARWGNSNHWCYEPTPDHLSRLG